MSIPSQIEGLEFMRLLSWEEVFEFWRNDEGNNPDWLAHAKERGFDSWEEWRGSYVAPFKLDARMWALYRVSDSMRSVPTFHGGPFRAWVEQIYGDAGISPTFDVIAERLSGQKNSRVLSLVEDFPKRTTIIGVLTENGVVVIEGTHRCAALALAAKEGKTIETDMTIALGSGLPGDLAIIGGHRKGESPTRG